MVVWGLCPQRDPGAEPLVPWSGGQSPPEAERFLVLSYVCNGAKLLCLWAVLWSLMVAAVPTCVCGSWVLVFHPWFGGPPLDPPLNDGGDEDGVDRRLPRGIHKDDLARPLYRRDIFYSGSLLHVNQSSSAPDIHEYVKSVTSVPEVSSSVEQDSSCCILMSKASYDTLTQASLAFIDYFLLTQ